MHCEVIKRLNTMSVRALSIQKKRKNVKTHSMISGLKVLALILFSNSISASDMQISKSCTDKNTQFEISELKFSFDLKHVSKINVLNGKSAASFISFKDNWLPDLNIITMSESNVSGGLSDNEGYQKLGVTDIDGFFNKLKSDSSKDDYLKKVRAAQSLEDKDDIEIINTKKYSVYILNDNIENEDVIYITRKNDTRIMMLVSDLKDRELNRLLENTCL